MPPSEGNSRIEELKKSLYSRTAPDVRTRRKLHVADTASDLKQNWGALEEQAPEPIEERHYEDRSLSFFVKLLIAAALFCLVAVGIGAYLFLNGSSLISGDNIDIQISGPVSIPGGTPVAFDIQSSNKNNVDLQAVDMEVSFPAGTTDPADPTKELTTADEYIGDLAAGASVKKTVQAIIFGEENLQKQVMVTLTYKIKGSNSIFTKTSSYDVLINSSPISVSVSSVKQITSGQEFDMNVELRSNSQQTLKSVLLKAQYPFGYTFISSNVQPLSDKATWAVGDIPPGGTRTITVHGKLLGEDADVRAFHFNAGARSSTNANQIGTQYMSVEQDLSIEKPFISLKVTVENDSSTNDYIGTFDQQVRVTIDWANNLPTPVSNVVLSAHLSGSAYDKLRVRPDIGYFRSQDNVIIWNAQTNPELQTVAAGASGSVSFTVTPTDTGDTDNPLVNPTVVFDVDVSGSRTQEANVPETLTAAVGRTIKVSSNVSLSGRIVRSIGPFQNTGPIPPKSEQTTTYTVIWTIDNTSSAVNNAQVVATIPPYVSWLGLISPATENMSFASDTGTITWNVGNVGTYAAANGRRREVAFQLAVTPGANQIDTSPTIINRAELTATDGFTGAALTSAQDYLTTSFSTDPAFVVGSDTVVQ